MNTTKQLSDKKILEQIQQVISQLMVPKEWLSLTDAANYIGVSTNTFNKYREMGLRVVEIDNVKRVSKTEIDNFLKQYMY